MGTYEKNAGARIYINGALDGLSTNNIDKDIVYDTTIGSRIGHSYINTSFFDGEIASVKVYAHTLSANEVLNNYQNPPSLITEDLVVYIDKAAPDSYIGEPTTNLIEHPFTFSD